MNKQLEENIKIKRVSFGFKTIHTEIIIDAAPNEVWTVLTDTLSYPEWSRFLVKIDGEIKDQGNIVTHFKVNDKKDKLNVIPHTISVKEGAYFYWSGKMMMGMKDDHRFIVKPYGQGKSKFVQSDIVRGGLSWVFGGWLMNVEKENYPKFNRALKTEVERRYPR